MFGLSVLQMLLMGLGTVTAALVFLMVHRLILGQHEGDQLFLEPGLKMMETEQAATRRMIRSAEPYVRTLVVLWVTLLIATVGVWLYTSFY